MLQRSRLAHDPRVTYRHKDNPLELRDYMRILSKSWWIIVATTMAGLLLGLGVSALMTPRYESTTTLYVSVRPGSDADTGDLFQGASFAQAAVLSYVDIATTAIVLDQVIDELDGELTRDALEEGLTVSSPGESALIMITANHPDPETAALVANTTGSVLMDVVQDEIEIAFDGGSSPVQVRTIDPGIVPGEAVSPNMLLNSVLGVLVGVLAGIGIAMLRGLSDNRLHTVAEIEELTDIPVVGRIAQDDHIARRPLVVHDDPRSPRAEAFRTLRTNLRYLGADDEAKVFVVSSPTPNAGKTHVTANLAVVLAQSGASVALIEADLRKPRLAGVMGIEGATGLSDVLIGRAHLQDVIQPWGTNALTVLPAGQIPPNPSELLGSRAMQQVLEELSRSVDYVLLDAPPILPVTDAAVISTYSSGSLMVTAAGQTKRQDFIQAVDSLEAVGSSVLGVIVNKVPTRSSDAAGFISYKYTDVDEPARVGSQRSS